MEYRYLGTTGIKVSEVGFGAWAIGGDAWGEVRDQDSIAAIRQAMDLGVTLIDTADVYGDGRSEQVVAAAIEGRRDDVVLSTKGGLMGHHRDPARAAVYGSPDKVLAALDASLRRLRTDHLDVYWCHIWWDHPEETEAFLTAFERMKRDGKVRAVGASTDNVDHLRHYAADGGIDAVQLDYSIVDRVPEVEVLPYAESCGLGVVVRGPLGKGLLTGKFSSESTFPPGDIRAHWPEDPAFRSDLEKVDGLRGLVQGDDTLGQLAIRFVLDHPAVTAAIPGAKTPAQAVENARASRRPLLTEHERSRIDAVAPSPAHRT